MSETENLPREGLVAKLETIYGLYIDALKIRYEMVNFKPVDHYKRNVIVPQFPEMFQTKSEQEAFRKHLDHVSDNAPEVWRIIQEIRNYVRPVHIGRDQEVSMLLQRGLQTVLMRAGVLLTAA